MSYNRKFFNNKSDTMKSVLITDFVIAVFLKVDAYQQARDNK